MDWAPGTPGVAGLPGGADGLAAVLLHPHPDFGGDRFNHVVDGLYRGLPEAGIGAARFDFSSSDPEAAGAQVRTVISDVGRLAGRIVVVGYSFGADIAATIDAETLVGWCLIAPPLALVPTDAMVVADDPRPKLVLVPEHDQFSPPDRTTGLVSGWPATTVAALPGADHFLVGHTAAVVDAARRWASALNRLP